MDKIRRLDLFETGPFKETSISFEACGGPYKAEVHLLTGPSTQTAPRESWQEFVAQTYGSLADAPIERASQGEFEKLAVHEFNEEIGTHHPE